MMSTAESPSDASKIAAAGQVRRSRSMIRCLAGASSSATKTKRPSGADSGMGVLSAPSERQRYFDLGASAGAPVDGKRGFSIGIQPSHTLPGHGQSEAVGVV